MAFYVIVEILDLAWVNLNFLAFLDYNGITTNNKSIEILGLVLALALALVCSIA